MPPPVRRKTLVLVLALGAALAFVAVAYAGNGGFAPETPHSPNASRINDSYKWISIFAALILVVVEGSLLWFVFRYRRRGRPRTAEGPQIHAHARLELIWTVIPVLILAAILAFLFYELPGIRNVPTAKAEGGEWGGGCAKCHALQGQGGYGPAIASSALLTQTQSLRQLLLNGQNRIKPIGNYMPPVGRGWTDRQFQALFAYVKRNVYKQAASGG